MDPDHCCPFCAAAETTCPHLLICMGSPGEVNAGSLGERLQRLWEIVIVNVGDDLALDARGVYADSWRELRDRFAAEADSMIESDRWTALFIADPSRMEDALERCIAADGL
jgi:CO dehydrogenase/acetyl-CoA synthase gamma subunit (corrinoid Fe-S protein)